MKLRYLFFALFSLATAATISAQTVSATTINNKAKTAKSVYNDLRGRKFQKATATVLADRDVNKYAKVNKDLQAKLADPKLVSNLRNAPAAVRKDPVSFAQKNAKTLRDLKKHRPKWLHRKSKKHVAAKK